MAEFPMSLSFVVVGDPRPVRDLLFELMDRDDVAGWSEISVPSDEEIEAAGV